MRMIFEQKCRGRTGRGGTLLGWLGCCILVSVLAGCATPITVTRVETRIVYQDLTRNVLSAGQMSAYSEIILNRANLAESFKTDPEAALADLHMWVAEEWLDRDPMFALAELSFLHAERTKQRKYFVAAAVYAYAFLFPPPGKPALERTDPRYRVACDLYNQSLTEALRSKDKQREVLEAGTLPLPLGSVTVAFDPAQLHWVDRRLSEFVPIGDFNVEGLRNTYRQAGVGAPLAANAEAEQPAEGSLVPAKLKVPVTAFLRLPDPWAYFRSGELHGTLELYLTQDTETVRIGTRELPLEAEPTAVLAYMLSASGAWDFEFTGFLLGDALRKKTSTQLIAMDPYRPGHIPVVFVHGTASSPARWAEMFNELQNDPRIRRRYQFWFFSYETGNPVLYSALRLREALKNALATLDPNGTDPALREMVLIGHSQGGLLVKLMVVDLEAAIQKFIAPDGLETLPVSDATREQLRQIAAVRPLPFVRDVIFMATPHRGSYVAGNWLAHQIARFVRLPATLLSMSTEVGKLPALRLATGGQFSSVYGMTPGSPLVKLLAPAPLAAGVEGYSIIAVDGDEPLDQAGDGVVKYRSAHLDDMVSEKVVQSGHSVQSNPDAIEEVRRILLTHAAKIAPLPESGQGQGTLPFLFHNAPPWRRP